MKTQLIKLTCSISLMLIATFGFSQTGLPGSGGGARPVAGKQSVAQLKGSPAGRHVVAVINGINGIGEINEAFVKQHFTPGSIERNGVDKLINILSKDIPNNDGKLTLYEADRPSTFEYKLKVKGSVMNEWVEIGFKMENASPYRIEGMGIEAGEMVKAPSGELEVMKLD